MASSASLGPSASDAATDALLDAGERPAGRSEWEDALIKHGIVEAPPPPQRSADDDLLERAAQGGGSEHGGARPLDSLSLDELDEALDDGGDERALQHYRARRLVELSASARRPTFGSVREIRGSGYVAEVTAASALHPVVVHLYSPAARGCRTVSRHLQALAARFPYTSFVEIVASEAIPGYPAQRTPTVLVYHGGELQAQLVGIGALGGPDSASADCIEWRLKEAKAVEGSGLTRDPFVHGSGEAVRMRMHWQGPGQKTARAAAEDEVDDGDDDDDDDDDI